MRKLGTLPNTSKHIHGLVSLGGRGRVSVTDGVKAGGLVWSRKTSGTHPSPFKEIILTAAGRMMGKALLVTN